MFSKNLILVYMYVQRKYTFLNSSLDIFILSQYYFDRLILSVFNVDTFWYTWLVTYSLSSYFVDLNIWDALLIFIIFSPLTSQCMQKPHSHMQTCTHTLSHSPSYTLTHTYILIYTWHTQNPWLRITSEPLKGKSLTTHLVHTPTHTHSNTQTHTLTHILTYRHTRTYPHTHLYTPTHSH